MKQRKLTHTLLACILSTLPTTALAQQRRRGSECPEPVIWLEDSSGTTYTATGTDALTRLSEGYVLSKKQPPGWDSGATCDRGECLIIMERAGDVAEALPIPEVERNWWHGWSLRTQCDLAAAPAKRKKKEEEEHEQRKKDEEVREHLQALEAAEKRKKLWDEFMLFFARSAGISAALVIAWWLMRRKKGDPT